ncbi:putative membrane protein [Pacificimonas flava]|uniref:Putative membrane protein n=2 Tax=Pacificimonas flava TaxID=1234595 RepID=M2U4H3_9SPHN|nr:putative membrane protein [Pacificimonas flava]
MLLFAATGITLNHAGEIEAEPVVTTQESVLPPMLLRRLAAANGAAVLPAPFRGWAQSELSVTLAGRAPEWSEEELYVPLPQPGGDGWLAVDLADGAVFYERTDRGTVAWLNDLHKGRDTGAAWRWFLDIFSAACLIFCITGFFLLQLHAKNRPSTWPIVGLGVIAPTVLLLVFVHS